MKREAPTRPAVQDLAGVSVLVWDEVACNGCGATAGLGSGFPQEVRAAVQRELVKAGYRLVTDSRAPELKQTVLCSR